ncbi:MAG: hypothetical protein GX577_12695 [Leptolinea sp.]|nr:hypothetical protein [Leptolinea sp.]
MKTGFFVVSIIGGLLALGCNLTTGVRSDQQPSGLEPSVIPGNDLPNTTAKNPASQSDASGPSDLLQPEDFAYLGAFRLPGNEDRPRTFAYGGNAMTFNPDGDPDGVDDGFPGSLFVMGHDRIAYGDVPEGNQVAEINIPLPVQGKNLEELATAEFIQGFSNVTAGAFTEMEEIPKVGMAYLNRKETGPLIHLAWGQHLQPQDIASHAWFLPDLKTPGLTGFWFIGNQDLYSVNGYMFEIPVEWADANTGGRYLGTGRMRDGGQGGMGPTLLAYRPWLDDGSPAPNGTHLEEVPLLLYEKSSNTEEFVNCMDGYQHADEWEGGAWLSTVDGKSAVMFAGTKATGNKTWYGYIHPDGPEHVCVDAHVTDYPTCRMADGSLCPQSDMGGCCSEEEGGCISMRGWMSSRFDAQIILYNPDDLAKVAAGEMEPWEPQPYSAMDIDEFLFLSAPEWETQMVASGDQRRYRIGDVAFDRVSGLLYVLEQYADEAKPVVHVWKVG